MRNEKLIAALENCIVHCNQCADACLDEDHVKDMVDCIRNDRVCIETCTALKNILGGTYNSVEGLVAYCARVCEECAEECEKHDAKHCQDCAEACRNCELLCKDFLSRKSW